MPVAARLALAAAALAEGAGLASETQTALSEALSKPSPVDAVVGCFRALAPAAPELSAGLKAALATACATLAENDFHGLAGDAAALAASL